MKTTTNLLVMGIVAAFGCSMGNAQINYSNALSGGTLIYSNVFNGGAVTIHGTAPTVANSILGGTNTATWNTVSNNVGGGAYLYQNGTVGTVGDSYLLPFKPQPGYVYTLTASVTVPVMTAGKWITLGFAATDAVNNTTPRFNDAAVSGNPWTYLTEGSGADFFFPTRATSIGSSNLMPAAGTYTAQLVLDTTGTNWVHTTNWVSAEFVNGTQVATNYPYPSNPTISAAGIGQTTLSSSTGIQWQYLTLSGTPLVIGQQPVSAGVGVGTAFTNSVSVAGSGPLSYQWYTNNVPITNATNSTLIINPVSTSNAGTNYYVVITNSLGSITSSVASLTVFTAPVFASELPVTYTNLFTLYAGVSPKFSVSVIGLQPHYQWYTNGVAYTGQTNAAFTWNNVPIGGLTSYCVVSNSGGSITSFVWTAQVVAAPAAPYPTTTLTLHPTGYWRLNDAEAGGGDDGVVANDYAGGNDGIYTNAILGNTQSYSPGTDPSDTSALFGSAGTPSDADGIEGIDFSAPASSNVTFSIEAWAFGPAQAISGAGIVAKGYGGGEQFDLDVTSGTYRFMVHDAGGNAYAATATYLADGNWHHLAGVCDEVNGVVSLYVDGVLGSSVLIASGSGLLSVTPPMTIGSRSSTSISGNDLQFNGYINDVTVFGYALSATQIDQQLSGVKNILPYFTQAPPVSVTANAGGVLTLPATVLGSTPIGYSWIDVNASTNVATGSTNALPLNASLTVNNVPASWNNDQLELTVTNAAGSTSVYVALTVYSNLTILSDLPANLSLLSGTPYTYFVTVAGPTPYTYQWYNASTLLSGQTNSTYAVTAGSVGSTATYHVVISNSFGAVTSVVSTLTSVAAPTAAYATGILQLNPAGYWPMHEVEAAAQGDIETNYGTLGELGTAYYPDWAASAGAFTRQVSGAITGDSDTALHFNYNVGNLGNGLGTWTNEIYIPHTSPLTTLNPPFSVECWLLNTNTSVGQVNQSVWGQFGWEGLNSGYAGSGVGAVDGIQLSYGNGGGINIYGQYNSTAQHLIITNAPAPLGSWNHVVVTCDASTNFSVYVNGALASSEPGVGQYSPDYWTPLTIGGTRGGTRSAIISVDEFAVYTNVISDIATHYNDGISGGAGVYFHDVTNDNPVVYLRMDARPYTQPGVGSWPELVNYGSVANPGNYSPGTLPGIVTAGPASNGTNYMGLSGTNVAALSGVSSFADAGYAAAYNPTGSNANFSVAALFRGSPCDNRVQAIVSHGTGSWQLNISTNGTIVFNAGNGNNASEGTGQSPGDIRTTGVYNDGKWHHVVAVNATNVVSIYVDGVLATSGTPSGITPTSVIPGNTGDVMIGADPSNTNNPIGVGRQFAGQVCEVAFFNQTLTSNQVQQVYDLAVNGSQVMVNPNPGPILYSVTGNQLTLSWPTNTGWTLQAQTNSHPLGINTNWVDVPTSTTTNQVIIPINPAEGSVFYRLKL